jgi:hypothetical protein
LDAQPVINGNCERREAFCVAGFTVPAKWSPSQTFGLRHEDY